jgi:uncharacterized protein (DUF2141 family)
MTLLLLSVTLMLGDGGPPPATAPAPAEAVPPAPGSAATVPAAAAPAAAIPAPTPKSPAAAAAIYPTTPELRAAPEPGAAIAPTAPAAEPATPAPAILAEVVGLHNDKGLVGCALWNTPDGFPGAARKALQYEFPKPEGRKATCRFEGYPAGTYAIVVYHDENSNHTLDQGFLGIPTEGWGASNDARPFMAAPSFSSAKFEYPGRTQRVLIHMHY